MSRIWFIFLGTVFMLTCFVTSTKAQSGVFQQAQGRFSGMSMGSGGSDSIGHRTGLEDSITIHFRYLDTSRMAGFDSTIYDFAKKIGIPWYHINLGNLGNANRSLLFEPQMKSGWDYGFHTYDDYNLTVEDAHFYNTTRPYAELNYLLGSKSEQFIRLMHTQNLKPNWNMGFEYRLINSPGFYQNQNTNHNNYRFTSWYQSKNKRWNNFIIIVGNKLQSGENGGIASAGFLDSAGGSFDDRSNIPTKLGPDNPGSRNFFSSNIAVGRLYTNATYLMRNQYDIGQKDSLVINDTTVVPLFYPRLRLEHTIEYSTYHNRYQDTYTDSAYYDSLYLLKLAKPIDTFYAKEYWKELTNDFSFYTFPDAKNAQQFLKLGASLQTLKGQSTDSIYYKDSVFSKSNFNTFLHGEYRNLSRNKKWDIEAYGNFYVAGYNAGDYTAYISLRRLISKQIGYIQVGFQNTNRTPSYMFHPGTTFYLDTAASPLDLKKENTTLLFGVYEQPKLKLKLTGKYYLVTNYTYYSGYIQVAQASTLFNVLQISGEKIFRIGGNWNWKAWVTLQQRVGDGPVNLPLISTRNQVGYDGSLGFKNLRISFGGEMRYFTPYKAPEYSPLLGQYFYQNVNTVRLERPDISAFLHFRIKSFNAYARAENLNAINIANGGGFTRNNMPTNGYPYPGLQIRVGIFWSFVN